MVSGEIIKRFCSKKIEKLFIPLQKKDLNPVVRAHNIWKIIDEQLKDVLGNTIHTQWFSKLVPLVISDGCLIIMSPDSFSARWVNDHYKDLIDLLISFQDKDISSFVLDRTSMETLECATSKINSQTKNSYRYHQS